MYAVVLSCRVELRLLVAHWRSATPTSSPTRPTARATHSTSPVPPPQRAGREKHGHLFRASSHTAPWPGSPRAHPSVVTPVRRARRATTSLRMASLVESSQSTKCPAPPRVHSDAAAGRGLPDHRHAYPHIRGTPWTRPSPRRVGDAAGRTITQQSSAVSTHRPRHKCVGTSPRGTGAHRAGSNGSGSSTYHSSQASPAKMFFAKPKVSSVNGGT